MEQQSTPKKKVPAALIAVTVIIVLLALLVGGYFGLCRWVQNNGLLLPGAVAVDDDGAVVADLSGLSQADAVRQMTRAMDSQLQERVLTVSYGDGRTATLDGSLLAYAPEAAVAKGMAAKESQSFWKLGLLWFGLLKEPVSMPVATSTFTQEGEAEAQRLAQQIAHELYVAPVDFTYELLEDTVTVVKGYDGRKALTDTLPEDILAALAEGKTQLAVETQPIPSAELSGKILSELVYIPPQSPKPDENGILSPIVIGISVDPDEAQTILDSIGPGESCTIPVVYIQPDLSESEAYLYQDLLASVTTNLDGVATRSFNVGRAASFCNDVIILPGEVFSYLDTIGDPSAANGYQTSTGYQNGQTVEMDGGGVCQVSSSLYYCAVYSNLEIVNRAAHAFATGYIPNGLDATVYFPSLDFKFRNSTEFPIKIVAYTEGGNYGRLTVQFYGTNNTGEYVETERHTLSSTPWETVYQPDESIPQGTTKVDVTPYTGYEVDVYRLVYDKDGNLISRTFENHSRYAKRDKVILYNPADAAALGLAGPNTEPSPEPTPDVTPEPTPDVTPQPTPDVTPEPDPEPSDDPVEDPIVPPWENPDWDPQPEPSDDPAAEPSEDAGPYWE